MTLMLMVMSALACGLSFGHTATSVMTSLCFFRFWLGFGIGGDYPLSATIMSEYANTRYYSINPVSHSVKIMNSKQIIVTYSQLINHKLDMLWFSNCKCMIGREGRS